MRAVTVVPGSAGSARVADLPEPDPGMGSVLVEGLGVGVCGTDVEIVDGHYGWAPPGREELVIGHESLGRVVEPGASAFAPGDLVVGIVRRPDPIPCPSCAVGEWDNCTNGLYTERGIKQVDGFMSERWRIEPDFAVQVDSSLGLLGVLLEPATVITKAWETILRIGSRAYWEPESVLVTGAGPIGLLAAVPAVIQGLDVHVLDRAESGPKPELVHDLGATYHTGPVGDLGFAPDIVVECTGVGALIIDVVRSVAGRGVVCLAGIGGSGEPTSVRAGELATDVVLGNKVVAGSVNANRRHYRRAARLLSRVDRAWLERLITRRVALEDFEDALHRQPDDIKVVVDCGAS